VQQAVSLKPHPNANTRDHESSCITASDQLNIRRYEHRFADLAALEQLDHAFPRILRLA
jgi:hypothetical protein